MAEEATPLRVAADQARADVGSSDSKAEQQRAIPRSPFERGGRVEKVGLNAEVRGSLSQCILNRYEIAKNLDNDKSKPRLNEYDRFLLQRGEGFVDKITGGEALSQDDLALAWSVVNDELVQKSTATRQEREDEPSDRFLVRRLREVLGNSQAGRIVDRFARPDTVRTTHSDAPHFSSAYLEKSGYATWDAERQSSELIALNELHQAVSQELGLSVIGEIPDLSATNGDQLHDATTEAAWRILERDHEGMSLVELQDRDPFKAIEVYQRAMREGLTDFARDSAIEVLKHEKPKADIESIDAHIANLKKKSSETELEVLKDEQADAKADYDAARDRYQELRAELRSSVTEAAKAQFDYEIAEEARDVQNPDVGKGVRMLDQQILDLQGDIRRNEREFRRLNTSPPAGMSDEAIERRKAEYTSSIDTARGKIADFATKRGDLDEAVSNAGARSRYYNGRITALEGTPATRGSAAVKGEVSTARKAAEQARKKNEKTSKNLKESEKGLTPVKDVSARALEQWKKVGVDYDKIINERFSQRREDRLTATKLGSALEVDGQIIGAERIREHIFKITDATWWANADNKELARRMLSDEAIAKGIIDTFRIDIGDKTLTVAGTSNVAFEDCFQEIQNRRGALNDALDKLTEEKGKGTKDAALKPFKDKVDAAKKDIGIFEKPLLQAVLPYLQQGNEFQIGDTMRYLINQGLQSAAEGAPYWNGFQGAEYIKPEAELSLQAESILHEHKGKATFIETNEAGTGDAPRVQWEGELNQIQDEALGFHVDNQTLDLTFRVTQTDDRYGVSSNVEVRIDEKFLQALPVTIFGMPDVPDSIRNLLYDGAGNLRTELRLRDRSVLERLMASRRDIIDNRGNMWLSTGDLRTNTTAQMSARLDAELAPATGVDVAVSTANTVLTMSPDERLNVVKGFESMRIDNVNILGARGGVLRNVGFAVDFDNAGRFWITETDAAGNRVGKRRELEHFYDVQEDAYRRNEGVQNLDPEQRRNLQGEFIKIQEEIGRRILSRQQRR